MAEPQDNEQATYATLLDRSMEHIDWSKTAQEVHNLIRGFNPAPSTFTKLPNGKSLKIWGSKMTGKAVLLLPVPLSKPASTASL